jgi:hypothetical protein
MALVARVGANQMFEAAVERILSGEGAVEIPTTTLREDAQRHLLDDLRRLFGRDGIHG